ncbi:hypothetical protein ABFS82_08G041700 [Erythranthe guttata]|uniref:lysM domain receptor-like kinase 4 n=1 Tax=Erythranthe guttata TaxID=4155 RepID=UPI00064DE4E1|nr:PREDICTED: lysM domain receptor-like kinase 4 [Erythranthe guttata]|eukprot:XP_012852629.1 PREDICTED: lysM domain receptor-like kinase 4 [Erythranthe guttata]
MNNTQLISAISIFLISFLPAIIPSQQPYIRQATSACEIKDNSTSVLGYTCNGARRRSSCQSYLTFRSTPPYDTLSAVSALFSVNSSQLAQLNSVPETNTAVFEADRMVLIPVTCSCSGEHYQVNASYVVRQDDTYFGIANATFQGLSTCQSLETQNGDPTRYIFPGSRITVPLRCACPTQNQSDAGVNYLLSYLVTWNQFVSSISALFGVDTGQTLAANTLSETDFNIYPFTTLLIPLRDPPTSSQVTGPQPPPPPSTAAAVPPPPASGGGSSKKTWVFAAVGALGGIVLASAVCFFFFRKHNRKSKPATDSSRNFESIEKPLRKTEQHENEDDSSQLSQDFLESISSIAQSLKVYPFQQLKSATQDFSPGSKIKGSVYLGTINGDLAAIKKMNGGDVSKEINLLNKINHFNLIRLSGVSFNEGQWYLVYEYASNGELSDWIHRKSEDQRTNDTMNWNKRLQIALDISAGLNYLHRYTSPPHIHKDLNSKNILLDENFRAKISNFGLSRSTDHGEEGQFALTRHIIGTKGYMAPEYLENGIVSTKMDVYSFGVVMLEILTGKEVSFFEMDPSEVLAPAVMSDDGHENLRKLIDPILQENYNIDLVLVLFKLIHRCLEKSPTNRPEMDDVFQSLSRISTSASSGEWAVSIPDKSNYA